MQARLAVQTSVASSVATTWLSFFSPSPIRMRSTQGGTLGAVFLLEALAGHPVWITYEREGSTFDVSGQRGRDLQIELNELGLDAAGSRKEIFVQVADLNLTLANLGDCSFPGHVTSYKRRAISLVNKKIAAKTV